jgi:hypothetical protein
MINKRNVVAAAGLLAAALLSGCNLPNRGGDSAATGAASGAAETAAAVQTRSGPAIEATGAALRTPAGFSTSTPGAAGSSTPSQLGTDESCDNRADFIDDVSVPDNTNFDAGDSFIKIWRLRNSGNCRWTPAFLLTFIGGNRLDAPSSVTLSTEVPPGELVDLSLDMQAPNQSGTYQGFWKLRSPEGDFFGIGPQGDQSFWVKIVVPAPPTSETSPSPTSTYTASASPTTSETVEATGSPTATETPTPTATSTPTATTSATPNP